MDSVVEYINSLNLSKDEYLIVACSGGPDSMLLLHLLHTLEYKVICAHVNHKTRVETDDEYLFVKNYCDINNIIFEGIELLDKCDDNFESYAREFRYKFFKSLTLKYNSNYVFTAHHGDDLVETIMMRIVRGSSLKGYRGFDKLSVRDGYNIVRPLVFVTKNDIISYLNEYNIDYVVDSSNKSLDYTRNRFRHNLLPFLKEEDEEVHKRFIKYNETLKDTYDYITRVVNNFLSTSYINNELNIDDFNKLDDFIKVKVLEEIFRIIFVDNLYLININHVNKVLEIINSKKVNVSINLVDNLYIIKSYNKLLFSLDNNINSINYKYELKDRVELDDGVISIVDKSDSNSNYVIRLNSKDIKLPLYIRNRVDGDRIEVKNMNGSKKVKDIFIDEKITLSDRYRWPILVDSDDKILWIPGLKKSKFDIPFDNVYDIIIWYEKGEKKYE